MEGLRRKAGGVRGSREHEGRIIRVREAGERGGCEDLREARDIGTGRAGGAPVVRAGLVEVEVVRAPRGNEFKLPGSELLITAR